MRSNRTGLLKDINKEFRGMRNYCKRVLKENNLSFPCIVPFNDNDRTVFNMVTKKTYYGNPTYITVTKCIEDMASMCAEFNIKYLGIPKLGCGLDRLQWGKVREILIDKFKDLDIVIEVCYL